MSKTSRMPRAHDRPWGWWTACLSGLALASWVAWWVLEGRPRPGSTLGIALGTVATALLTLAMLYGVRRRAMSRFSKWPLGSAHRWLRWHVHGSVLFLVTMLLHSAPGWPHGALSWALWSLSLWTVASGLLGLTLQRTLPRALTARSGFEVLYERIPELVDALRQRAEALVDEERDFLGAYYDRRLAPLLAAPRRDPLILLGSRGELRRLEPLQHLHELLPGDDRERLEELEDLVRSKLDLDVHYTLQQALRGWLWLHVPPAIVLWVLVLVHVLTVLYY